MQIWNLTSAINVLSGCTQTGQRQWRARPWLKDYFIVRAVSGFVTESIGAYVKAGDQVLDIGCGDQPYRAVIEEQGATYIGVDLAQNSLSSVAVIAAAEKLPLAAASCDVVLCTEVLEHTERLEAAVDEMSRVLKPGGKLIATCPFAYPLHLEPHDFQRLTPHLFNRLAGDYKLEVVSFEKAGNEITLIFTAVDHMFTERGNQAKSLPLKLLHGSIRLATNLVAIPLDFLFGRWLRQDWYTHNLVVLRKQVI